MNKREWIGLLMIYVGYLFLGATVFYFIEFPNELDNRRILKADYDAILDLLQDECNTTHMNHHTRVNLFLKLEEYCGKPLSPNKSVEDVAPQVWDYYNSFFFVVTVVSTIGYGNLHPTTDFSRILMIFYAVIGIPLNGVVLTSLGQFFGEVFLRAHTRYKSHHRFGDRISLAVNILTYLIPGMIFFIFLPAGVISYFEDWDYVTSVYFTFVSLTTIGFGEIVAGQKDYKDYPTGAVLVYKIYLICWVIFGLGYLIMLLGFVAQVMNAQKLVHMEHKFVQGLTHSWHTLAKDIQHLRKNLNQSYFNKITPVFREGKPQVVIHRSHSLPVLTPEEELLAKNSRRQRTLSEHPPHQLQRMFSESDLQRIDKNATFASKPVPSQDPLINLAFLLNGNNFSSDDSDYEEDDDDDDDQNSLKGVHGFSDEEVLASEKNYDEMSTLSARSKHASSLFYIPSSNDDTVSRQPHRGRAMSECPPAELQNVVPSTNPAGPVDWTWSGPKANKLHDYVKQRHKQNLMARINNERKGSLSQTVIAGAKRLIPGLGKKSNLDEESNKKSNSDMTSSKITLDVPKGPTKRRSLQENSFLSDSPNSRQYKTITAMGDKSQLRERELNLLKFYRQGGRLFPENSPREDLAGKDLSILLALTNLHARVGERIINADQSHPHHPKPKRKLGTASLTPPRIRSLLDLFEPQFPPPSPRVPKKRKPSMMQNIFRSDSRRDIPNPQTVKPEGADKLPNDSSHIKKLGRFLLRRYSNFPKDGEEAGPSKPSLRRKRFSLWPSESEDKDIPQFQVQIDSPETTSLQSLDVVIPIEATEEKNSVSDKNLLSPRPGPSDK